MNNLKLLPDQEDIRRRIIEISFQRNLSHLGSNLSVVDIIYAIYKIKNKNDRFILSSGHAGIALYAILEKYGLITSSDINNFFIHPDRNPQKYIDLSTGSLGHGLPIAAGMAFADRRRNVYCIISDGECAEGSIWEALRIGLEQKISNLKIVVNANGWGAYGAISLPVLLSRIKGFGYKTISVDGHSLTELSRALLIKIDNQPLVIFAKTKVKQFPFLNGQDAHYYTMNENDYKLAIAMLR